MKKAVLTILSISAFTLASPAMAQYAGAEPYGDYGGYYGEDYQPGIVGGAPNYEVRQNSSDGGSPNNTNTNPSGVDKGDLNGLIGSVNPSLEEVERARISRIPDEDRREREYEILEQRLEQNTSSITRSHGRHQDLTTLR